MTNGRKLKVSVSLSSGVLSRVDEQAKRTRTTRSAVMEEWLQAGEQRAADASLAAEVEAYYRTLGSQERREADAIAAASSKAARTLDVDEKPSKPPRRRR